MPVLINNQQSSHRIDQGSLHRQARDILGALDCGECELSILIVDDSRMAELNRQYLRREGPTNVIAFPMRSEDFAHLHPELLGDVVLSADTALLEAKELGQSFEERMLNLLIHGILHLLGYDHQKGKDGRRHMDEKAHELLEKVAETAAHISTRPQIT
ncbi:rRNA maturation RNase YbeY [Thermodesulfobacteriota bacterium]